MNLRHVALFGAFVAWFALVGAAPSEQGWWLLAGYVFGAAIQALCTRRDTP